MVGGLREVRDAGADTILLDPMGADVAEDREQMERLSAEVGPDRMARSGRGGHVLAEGCPPGSAA